MDMNEQLNAYKQIFFRPWNSNTDDIKSNFAGSTVKTLILI